MPRSPERRPRKLDEIIANSPDLAPSVRQVVNRFSLELRGASPQSETKIFHLVGLAQSLVNDVLQAEYRAREDGIHERYSKKEFRDRFDLEKELRQVREEEERGSPSPWFPNHRELIFRCC